MNGIGALIVVLVLVAVLIWDLFRAWQVEDRERRIERLKDLLGGGAS